MIDARVIESLTHDAAVELVDWFIEERLLDQSQQVHPETLVVILRGMPGSGKTSFARFMKLYATSRGLSARRCSADRYFDRLTGFNFNAAELSEAHQQCKQRFDDFIQAGVDVVIVDNTNIRRDEFEYYQTHARCIRFCQVVSFICTSVHEAVWLNSRSLHKLPDNAVHRRFYEYEHANHYLRDIPYMYWIESHSFDGIIDDDEVLIQRAQFRQDQEIRDGLAEELHVHQQQYFQGGNEGHY
jgi:tRNA uridine 5-carbamoylmethylation protein Kti12